MRRRTPLWSLAAVSLLAPLCLALSSPAPASASSAPMPNPAVAKCDVLVTTPAAHDCLLPWPNNAFTKTAATPTGRLVNLAATATPANTKGVHINPAYQNQNDGFSPGSVVMLHVPNLSIANSGIATSTNIGLSGCTIGGKLTSTTTPVVLWDATRHVCVPYFAELDAQDPTAATQLLLIHPVVNYTEGDRIDVVLRNLYDTSDARIPMLAGEAAALNGTMVPTTRGAHLKWLVTHDLTSFDLSHLYVAWDFSVISAGGTSTTRFSDDDLADPALTMRDQAFKLVGSTTPVYRVTSAAVVGTEYQVSGSFQVPTFLTNCPTVQKAQFDSTDTANCGGMHVNKHGLPLVEPSKLVGGTWTNQLWADFICVMPTSISSSGAALPTLYGHGLLGDATEVAGSSFVKGVAANMMGCATDWSGMSSNDTLLVAGSLTNMSSFDVNVDHMLQGFVNFQFLARLITSPKGFATSPDFKQGTKVRFQVGKCGFQGYSQGGIMGGALSAVSTQWSRAILGVPGENYGGLLLNRSVDWGTFQAIYNKAYPDPTDQELGLQLAQMLWDRGENEGYAENLTSHPYAGTKAKQVFIIENYGDHQVANVSAEMLARTIGAQNHQPAFNPSFFGGPSRANVPVVVQWGLSKLNQTKGAKAGLVLWDYGTPTPPTT
ncbi:MAG TPA: hypothetical protein VKT18_05950, partial [Acidimicrobiales bacterium]|nr:hypothetical protein [Acidimicrobiales bacterium]